MRRIVCVLAFMSAGQVMAQGWSDLERMEMADALGSLLAAEEMCGLAYDHAAIEAFIDENVPADDMGFMSTLQGMTVAHEFQQDEMSESQMTAQCRQARRVSQSHGFLEAE